MSSLGPASGDPGSCSSTAAWLSGLGRTLARAAEGARSEGTVGEAWHGRPAREAAARHDALLAATTTVATTVATLGPVLQDHATDLATAQSDVRRIAERADAAGLTVTDGRVLVAWGVRGVAGNSPDDRTALAERLQRELDLGLTQLARRRERLVAVLAEARTTLARSTTPLR